MKTIFFLISITFCQIVNAQDIPAYEPPPDAMSKSDTTKDGVVVFEKVEMEAKPNFDWKKFLQKNLNGNIPQNNNAPKGTYTVIIKFVVNKDGNLSNFTFSKNPGYGTTEEVLRIIKKSPKWKPAIQNGRIVNSWHTQPVTFVVQ